MRKLFASAVRNHRVAMICLLGWACFLTADFTGVIGKRWTFDTTESILVRFAHAGENDVVLGVAMVTARKQSHSGMVDALMEVGKQRQQILGNLRSAFEKKDLEGVLVYVEQLVGLDKNLEGSIEKSH